MLVEAKNLRTAVRSASADELRWLRDYLAFDTGSRLHRRRIDMLEPATRTFPTGFLEMARAAAAKDGHRLDVLDLRVPPVAPDPAADLSWLRDYQAEAVARCVERTRGVLWLPTGAGKTEIAVGLAQRLPCRWLFLVHMTQLVDQAADRYELRTGQVAGRIGEGQWSERRFTAATFQTLYARLKEGDPRATSLLRRAEGLLVDEVHVLPAASFWRVAMAAPDAYYRVGMSGTPLARDDNKSPLAVAATGRVIYRLRPETLIEAGVLSRPRIRLLEHEHDPDSGIGAYPEVYRRCITENAARNADVVALTKRATKPALVFVREIDHGKLLLRELERAGVRAEFVWGAKETELRKAAIRRLTRGDLDVIVASVVFNVGVDIPSLRSLIVASAGKSAIASIQRIGRGMRVQKDRDGNVVKDEFEVYDFRDRGIRVLEEHAAARQRAYVREGYETVVLSRQGVLL